MCTCPAALHQVPQARILYHHLMTALNLNRNPTSIGVRLYIVRGERVLDVDGMSSDGCPMHVLREGEYNIHSSNQGQVRTSISNFFSMSIANNVFLDMDSLFQLRTTILFFFASPFAEVRYMGGQHCPLSM